MNSLESLRQQAKRLQRQMAEIQKELDELQEKQTCMQRCLERLDVGASLSDSDLELIDESQTTETSPILLRIKYKGRLAVVNHDIEQRSAEANSLLQAFKELSKCPACNGTGWTGERTTYERQERLIVARPGLQRCQTCNGTGRIEL